MGGKRGSAGSWEHNDSCARGRLAALVDGVSAGLRGRVDEVIVGDETRGRDGGLEARVVGCACGGSLDARVDHAFEDVVRWTSALSTRLATNASWADGAAARNPRPTLNTYVGLVDHRGCP